MAAQAATSSTGGSNVGWGAIAAAVIGGVASSEANKKAASGANKNAMALNRTESIYAMQRSAFDAATTHYYDQLDKGERKRGLDQYRKFSTVGGFAPNFHDTNPGPDEAVLPTIPGVLPRVLAPSKKHFGTNLVGTTPYLVDKLTGDGKANHYVDAQDPTIV